MKHFCECREKENNLRKIKSKLSKSHFGARCWYFACAVGSIIVILWPSIIFPQKYLLSKNQNKNCLQAENRLILQEKHKMSLRYIAQGKH